MTLGWRWAPYVLSLELKKAFSYRVDFWVQFLVGVLTDIGVAYFLWKAIFLVSHSESMQGFSLHGIVYYYLFASFSGRIARGSDRGYLAQDIYDGSLTRYLLYPLPFLGYKYITHISQQLLAVLQLILAFWALTLLLGLPKEQNITVVSFCAGTLTCIFAGYMHFMMASALEMVAFWQDVVWNLMVMLRFTGSLLGGGMIPLTFFPDWGQKVAALTPFPLLIGYPVQTFLGTITLNQWLQNFGMLCVWSLFFTWLCGVIWNRGTKLYSGVGI